MYLHGDVITKVFCLEIEAEMDGVGAWNCAVIVQEMVASGQKTTRRSDVLTVKQNRRIALSFHVCPSYIRFGRGITGRAVLDCAKRLKRQVRRTF